MREAAVVDGYGVSDPQLEYITRTLQTPAKLCRSPLSECLVFRWEADGVESGIALL